MRLDPYCATKGEVKNKNVASFIKAGVILAPKWLPLYLSPFPWPEGGGCGEVQLDMH